MIISFLCLAYTERFLVFDQPTQYDYKKKKMYTFFCLGWRIWEREVWKKGRGHSYSI